MLSSHVIGSLKLLLELQYVVQNILVEILTLSYSPLYSLLLACLGCIINIWTLEMNKNIQAVYKFDSILCATG